jgi:hypothetical protein
MRSIYSDNINFKWESLATSVFNAPHKGGDSFGIARQEFYNYIADKTNEGRSGLTKVITKMISDYPKSSYKVRLLELDELSSSFSEEEIAFDIVTELHEIATSLGY